MFLQKQTVRSFRSTTWVKTVLNELDYSSHSSINRIMRATRKKARERRRRRRRRRREKRQCCTLSSSERERDKISFLAETIPHVSVCLSLSASDPLQSFALRSILYRRFGLLSRVSTRARAGEKMSDTVELQILSMAHAQMTTTAAAVTSPIRKQQPASKVANRYLSTAAQYLTRTRSFHVSSNKQNNGNASLSAIRHDDLARSIPRNMPTNNPSKEDLPVNQPDGPTKSLDDNKSQGIVNTLRRSLRKSKERFYNKRSATMKSCHSLHNYEYTGTPDPSPSMAMTPTLLSRHQYLSRISTPKARTSAANDKQIRKSQTLFVILRTPNFVVRDRSAGGTSSQTPGCLSLVGDLFSFGYILTKCNLWQIDSFRQWWSSSVEEQWDTSIARNWSSSLPIRIRVFFSLSLWPRRCCHLMLSLVFVG